MRTVCGLPPSRIKNMKKTKIYLSVHGGGEEQKFITEGEVSERSGRTEYRFRADGAQFTITFSENVVIERKGNIAYRIELNETALTQTMICTEFGFLPAEVKTIRSEKSLEHGLEYKGEYEMRFEEFSQRHTVKFRACDTGRADV